MLCGVTEDTTVSAKDLVASDDGDERGTAVASPLRPGPGSDSLLKISFGTTIWERYGMLRGVNRLA